MSPARLPRWLLLAPLLGACAQTPPTITGRVETEDLHSAIVGDTYRVLVRLPPGYDEAPDRRWPVVYQLDGTSFGPEFEIAAGHASRLEAEGRIPGTIVVGIGYPYEDPLMGGKKGRSRDYVTLLDDGKPGGLAAFLRFLREELVPRIDGAYRTDPTTRALSGHSLGGFVALHTMLATALEEVRPFDRFVACDPGSPFGDPDRLFLDEQALSRTTSSLPARLHYEIARYDGAVQQLKFAELRDRLRRHFPDLVMTTTMSDTDHGGVISPCIASGLLSVLGGGLS